MAVVELDHISKRYDSVSQPAVDDVSLTIGDGEFLVLLGPSGCGKSTTLRMIAGLETITSGKLSIDGEVMNHVPAKDRDIAMVFQSYALYPHMTVRDNLAFGLRRRRVARAEIRRRVESVAETLGLSELLDRKPYALSGGQRQRVALGRAIVRDPKVFLFDEPLSNLDAALRVRTRAELIKLYHRIGATMIYVTHDQVEAMTMGTRICVMNKGKMVQVGAPMEVYRNPSDTFVASFIGNPAMNLMRGEIDSVARRPSVRVAGAQIPLASHLERDLLDLSSREVLFGIRPEDMYQAIPGDAPPARFAQIDAEVVATEPLGAETLLVLSIPDLEDDVIARVGREARAVVGERVRISIDLHAVQLFDPATTAALPRSGAPAKGPAAQTAGRTA